MMKMPSKATRVLFLVAFALSILAGASCRARNARDRNLEEKLSRAKPIPLHAVRLTGGPLQHAQDLNAKYLIELEPDRMLAYYRIRAGLEPKAEPYGGWDGGGRNLTGHIAGHYLSAVSLMHAATGDLRFKERADYVVRELKEVQNKNGDGYLGALEGGREAFDALSRGEIKTAGFDLNGLWSPWYTLHKTYSGLRDAYRYTGNRTALEVEIKFAAWAEKILSGLTEAQTQSMLNTEFGGMNEVLVDLYADTGDTRWLELSSKFEHKAFIFPLRHVQDNLAGKHGNTQIPKLIGSADRFAYTGDAADFLAASFFFERVARHHSYATGGNTKDEYFGEPGKLSERVDDRTAETCNVYNMIKLARRLFEFNPDAAYADFHERAIFNHILASIDPEDGRTCYMVPVGRGVQREYQEMFRSFTCCVGTGMESHALHGFGLFYESANKLWINIYAPSKAEWEGAGAKIAVDTDFPEGESATINLELKQPRRLTIALRRPCWAGEGFKVVVNGEPFFPGQEQPPAAAKVQPIANLYLKDIDPGISTYVEIDRTWKSGDIISVTLPKTLRLEATPDNPKRAAVLWGPLVLAGDIGPEFTFSRESKEERPTRPVIPVFIAAGKEAGEWVKPVLGETGRFRTAGVGRPTDVDLYPFYRLHRRMYAVYWDLFTEAGWKKQQEEYAAEQERIRRLEAITVAYAQPGEMQPERDFNYQGENATLVRTTGRSGRGGSNWFSFDTPVHPSRQNGLVVTYHSGERRRGPAHFDILVDGKLIASQTIEASPPSRFYDLEYPLPLELTRGKTKVTVRFQAKEDREIGPVFGIRIIRR